MQDKRTIIYDIGLVEIRDSFEFGEKSGIYPACLPSHPLNGTNNEFLIVCIKKKKK
jgi:hypothetical protein